MNILKICFYPLFTQNKFGIRNQNTQSQLFRKINDEVRINSHSYGVYFREESVVSTPVFVRIDTKLLIILYIEKGEKLFRNSGFLLFTQRK